MRMRTLSKAQREEGASLVEFSLVAFMFIIVLLSVVEMARMILVYTTLADAAHAGMRYAIVHGADNTAVSSGPSCAPSSCTGINTVVKNYAGAGLVNTANVTVSVSYPNSSNLPGQPVMVTVTYTYDPLVSYFSSKLNKNMGSVSQGIIVF
ncbi:MAG TPA: TadE/TadG family type IV pilus assembly protein [Acidobacteriaceae bacterium]|nr:TadE/TadG family type IV pilus assembly protein [Acidobacteriaceae bacterium]